MTKIQVEILEKVYGKSSDNRLSVIIESSNDDLVVFLASCELLNRQAKKVWSV